MYSMYGVCACIHVDWYVCGNLRGPPSDKGGDGDKGRRREAQRGLDITGIFFFLTSVARSPLEVVVYMRCYYRLP